MFQIIATLILTHPPVPEYTPRTVDDARSAIVSVNPKLDGELNAYLADAIAHAVVTAGERWDIDPIFLVALAAKESRLTPTALGDNGKSHGLYQINVNTAWGRKGSASPCRRSGVCGKKALRCMTTRDQCLLAIDISTETAAWLLHKYRAKRPGHAGVLYNCGRRCCVKRNKRGRCVRHARWTNTARGYFRWYRRLVARVAVSSGVEDDVELEVNTVRYVKGATKTSGADDR